MARFDKKKKPQADVYVYKQSQNNPSKLVYEALWKWTLDMTCKQNFYSIQSSKHDPFIEGNQVVNSEVKVS